MRPDPGKQARIAANNLAALFRAHGWKVGHQSGGPLQPDLVACKGRLRYAVGLKSMREGRPDRAVAVLAQAILQARRYAHEQNARPLAVVQVAGAAPSLFGRIEAFQRDYAPDVAVGLVSESGQRCFIGAGLGAFDAKGPPAAARGKATRLRKASALFSDLNQWMLKVLLAPELPAHLLHAPRGEYAGGSALAEAAQVSAMSASRFVRRAQEEGFLEQSGNALRLVRRNELFRRWQSAASRDAPELRMRYLIPAPGAGALHEFVSRTGACVGLFAAAECLGLGHVSGVAPHVYVRRLSTPPDGEWPGLVPAAAGEAVELVLRQAAPANSIFRGALRVDGDAVCDVLQVWLDVSAHSSRGAEQADWLRRTVLADVMGTDA